MTEAVGLARNTGYQLIAADGEQLTAAHEQMIEWSRRSQGQCDIDLAEERENLRIAEERKWATSPFRRRISMLEKRRVFYEKIEIALHAGYVIVPNFAMDVFAIRTKAETPKGDTQVGYRHSFQQSAQILPAGEGEFKNPAPEIITDNELEPDDKGVLRPVHYEWPACDFSDIEFPITLAKPALMEKTALAMAGKVFDEIGVANDLGASVVRGSSRVDPIILGRVLNPRKGRPALTFFIGWYFDPSRL